MQDNASRSIRAITGLLLTGVIIFAKVLFVGVILHIHKLVSVRHPYHEDQDTTWWILNDYRRLKYPQCPTLDGNWQLLPVGTSRLKNLCPFPGPHRIFKTYRLEEITTLPKDDKLNSEEDQQEKFTWPRSPLTKVYGSLEENVQSSVPYRDLRRMDLFASESSIGGFMSSMIMLPFRAARETLIGQGVSNLTQLLARAAGYNLDDTSKDNSVYSFYGDLDENNEVNMDSSVGECPRMLLPDIDFDPIVSVLSFSSRSVKGIEYFDTEESAALFDYVSKDFSEKLSIESLDCVKYYFIDQFPLAFTKLNVPHSPYLEDKGSYTLDESVEFPPSYFLKDVYRFCSGEYGGNSMDAVPFNWAENYGLLGVRSVGNDASLSKIFQRWMKLGDVFSPMYYQSSLVLAVNSTMYWYMIPFVLWILTSSCSTAPIILAHVPRLVLYITLANWRYFGLYLLLGKLEATVLDDFDFSDHIVIFMLQILILVFEMAAAARAIAVLRSEYDYNGPLSKMAKKLWIKTENIITLRIRSSESAKEFLNSSDDNDEKSSRMVKIVIGTTTDDIDDLFGKYDRSWVLRLMIGERYNDYKNGLLAMKGHNWITQMLYLCYLLPSWIIGQYCSIIAFMYCGGIRNFIKDFFGADDDSDEFQMEETPNSNIAPPSIVNSIKCLNMVIFIALASAMSTLYVSFYTALFFHTRLETLIGFVVAVFGLYLPIWAVINFRLVRAEGFGLIDRKLSYRKKT